MTKSLAQNGPMTSLKERRNSLSTHRKHGLHGIYYAVVIDDYDEQNRDRLFCYVGGVSTNDIRPVVDLATIDIATAKGIWCGPLRTSFGTTRIQRDAEVDETISFGIKPPQPRKGDAVGVMFIGGSINYPVWVGSISEVAQAFTFPGLPSGIVDGEDDFLVGTETSRDNPTKKQRQSAGKINKNIKESGLSQDLVRGAGTAGSTRESPSRVSGWKSRGDPNTDAAGHFIVLDDLPEASGIRLRTSYGHQITMSDATKSIYISTSKGNSWIEMSENGHIEMYSDKEFAIHAKGDLNLTSTGDTNLDVGGDFNIKVAGSVKGLVSSDYNISIDGNYYLSSNNIHTKSSANTYISADNEVNIKSNTDMKLDAGLASHIKGGTFVFIDAGTQVQSDQGLADSATSSDDATKPSLISLSGPTTISDSINNQIGADTMYVDGRARRVPQREPYRPDDRLIFASMETTGHRETSPYDRDENRGLPNRLALGLRGTTGSSNFTPNRRGTGTTPSSPDELPKLDLDNIQYLVVHCSATPADRDIGAAELRRIHLPASRRLGFKNTVLGYHKVIRRDGSVEEYYPEDRQVAHVVNSVNKVSIAICMIGGIDNNGKAQNNFTDAQFETLSSELDKLEAKYPRANVMGHRNFNGTPNATPKDCPSFDVVKWRASGDMGNARA